MNPDVERLLAKAERELDSAHLLFEKGHLDGALNRAYYAMFHAAESLLASQGLSFRTHAGVHRAFSKRFVLTGRLDGKLASWLTDTAAKRERADYGIEYSPEPFLVG